MAKLTPACRTKKDLDKLHAIIAYFKSNFAAKYPVQLEFTENYLKDAEHYYKKKDYFSSFGCANYAYGILEGVLLKETGKTFHEIETEAK